MEEAPALEPLEVVRPENARACLIGGTGRSGSTILKQVFSRHPDVAATRPEWRFVVDPDGLIDFYDSFAAGWSPYLFDQKVRRLRSLLAAVSTGGPTAEVSPAGARQSGATPQAARRTLARRAQKVAARAGANMHLLRLRPRYAATNLASAHPGLSADVEALFDELVEFEFAGRWAGTPQYQPSTILHGPPRSPEDLASILGRFYQRVLDGVACQQGATHVVEDSPLNLTSFDRILKLAPGARMVHIHRDTRDVVASYTGKRWGPSDPVQSAVVVGGIMTTWWQVRASVPQESFLEVSLEHLVAEPAEVLGRICDFWDLPWHESLLSTELSGANSGRWRTELDSRVVDEVSGIVAPILEEYGYT